MSRRPEKSGGAAAAVSSSEIQLPFALVEGDTRGALEPFMLCSSCIAAKSTTNGSLTGPSTSLSTLASESGDDPAITLST